MRVPWWKSYTAALVAVSVLGIAGTFALKAPLLILAAAAGISAIFWRSMQAIRHMYAQAKQWTNDYYEWRRWLIYNDPMRYEEVREQEAFDVFSLDPERLFEAWWPVDLADHVSDYATWHEVRKHAGRAS